MTPEAIIELAGADQVQLVLSRPRTLKASGPRGAVARWLHVIRESKPAILALLRQQQFIVEREVFEERAAIMGFSTAVWRVTRRSGLLSKT